MTTHHPRRACAACSACFCFLHLGCAHLSPAPAWGWSERVGGRRGGGLPRQQLQSSPAAWAALLAQSPGPNAPLEWFHRNIEALAAVAKGWVRSALWEKVVGELCFVGRSARGGCALLFGGTIGPHALPGQRQLWSGAPRCACFAGKSGDVLHPVVPGAAHIPACRGAGFLGSSPGRAEEQSRAYLFV